MHYFIKGRICPPWNRPHILPLKPCRFQELNGKLRSPMWSSCISTVALAPNTLFPLFLVATAPVTHPAYSGITTRKEAPQEGNIALSLSWASLWSQLEDVCSLGLCLQAIHSFPKLPSLYFILLSAFWDQRSDYCRVQGMCPGAGWGPYLHSWVGWRGTHPHVDCLLWIQIWGCNSPLAPSEYTVQDHRWLLNALWILLQCSHD